MTPRGLARKHPGAISPSSDCMPLTPASLVGCGLAAVALGLRSHELVWASAPTVLGVAFTIRMAMIALAFPLGWIGGRTTWGEAIFDSLRSAPGGGDAGFPRP